jgi:glycosyltransferase involved in cell wall biosynthesis
LAVRRADHILADSHATQADLVALLNVPPERVTTVHLAADSAFRPLPEEETRRILAQYSLQPGYLLFVGTLEPRKNVPGLLQAYRSLFERRVTTAPLVLVGSKGWLYDEIFQRVAELGLTKQVRFIHDASDADLPGLYNGASVLAIPSFYEGFGLPALEALSCGTPAVAANRASLPEVVGEAGLLVDPDDPEDIAQALARVLTDEPLRLRLRQLGLAQAARFTWERTARETLAVYQTVLAR